MEVGAVKQAFNNEVIQLKRNLNQAKIQTIHKLTRKAKTLTGKKAPDKLKDKLKRKAESAVNEVLILKKIKPKDVAKFAVTHTGSLQDYLNKPAVDKDKACARLLLHKSLLEKYKFIRNTFSNISINDLLMSRNERRKLKKDAQEQQKKKKDKKKNAGNAEGEWEVKKLESKITKPACEEELSGDDEGIKSSDEVNSELMNENSDGDEIEDNDQPESDVEGQSGDSDGVQAEMETDNDDLPEDDSDNDTNIGKFVRPSPDKSPTKPDNKPKFAVPNLQENNTRTLTFEQLGKNKNKPEIKPSKFKDPNKNKNLNEKLLKRKFKKDAAESKVQETKVVDPFFITSTGENYMSVVEPRQPDEVKEVHKQGNRKLRRAAMFGYVPKIKPRKDFDQNNFNRQNGLQGFKNQSRSNDGNRRNESQFDRSKNSQFNKDDGNFKGRNDANFKGRNDSNFKRTDVNVKEQKEEKLHPSWEAKKKKSGLLPFQGKKIVFDES